MSNLFDNNLVLHHYDEHHLPVSASIIVPMLMNIYKEKMGQPIQSVIDIGCGLGQWLYVFKKEGTNEVLGIDGKHLLFENLYIDNKEFLPFDLTQCKFLKLAKKYNLAISLEVAEHLPESVADDYVGLLTKSADTILFSAAIPNQTGENHINEQPHKYWSKKFNVQGYYMLDIFRPIIWNNTEINWWYRQNIFLCVKKDNPIYNDNYLFDGRQLVHPDLLQMYVDSAARGQNNISPRSLKIIKTFIKRLRKLFQ